MRATTTGQHWAAVNRRKSEHLAAMLDPRSEREHQERLEAELRDSYEEYPDLRFHAFTPGGIAIPHPYTIMLLTDTGILVKGQPDFLLFVSVGDYTGLAIELKVGKNRATREQRAWVAHLAAQGWCADVVVGWQAALALVLQYVKGEL